jgi:plasmid stabilization system protein ParE
MMLGARDGRTTRPQAGNSPSESSRAVVRPATADRLIDAIVERFELLAEQPRMGRLRPEFGEAIRSFTVENHVIYYRHDRDVLIARVLHGRRDQAAAWSG